ncbi:unnamed protein product [Penicillium manginii]
MPKSLIRKRIQHYQLSKERVNRRLEMKTSRPDFISYILRYNDDRTMDTSEIQTNAALIIQAGSETTATALAACNFYLQKNRDCYTNLIEEIRNSFKSEDEITFLSVAKLPFLNAVIEEGLRMYPPSPAIVPRLVPKGGALVCGEILPEYTSVSVAHYSAFRGASNFEQPNSFIPKRWLQQDGKSRFKNDKREALQPFSMGPRACIGRSLAYAEMRLILCKLFWNFDIELDPRANNWDKAKSYIVWENRPLWVHLRRARHLSGSR